MRRVAHILFTVVALGAAACGRGGSHEVSAGAATPAPSPPASAPRASATATTPTTAPPPTFPLTGMLVPTGDTTADRPAVVVKIDGAAAARPQTGLNQADVVYEIRVEGISRFAAVFHSHGSSPVGPVRSARESDINIVAALRTPLLAWSGGNGGVRDLVHRAEDIGVLFDVGHDARAGDYWRDNNGRYAPHNLYTDTEKLLAAALPTMGAPAPLFDYRDPDAKLPPTATPAQGAWAAFSYHDDPTAEFVWDESVAGWRRFAIDGEHGLADSAHVDSNGVQIAPDNVVILTIPYEASSADARSPEAITIGTGRAVVLTKGHAIAGHWRRDALADGWTLRDERRAPIRLTQGTTWVALVLDGGSGPITPERAAELLAVKK